MSPRAILFSDVFEDGVTAWRDLLYVRPMARIKRHDRDRMIVEAGHG